MAWEIQELCANVGIETCQYPVEVRTENTQFWSGGIDVRTLIPDDSWAEDKALIFENSYLKIEGYINDRESWSGQILLHPKVEILFKETNETQYIYFNGTRDLTTIIYIGFYYDDSNQSGQIMGYYNSPYSGTYRSKNFTGDAVAADVIYRAITNSAPLPAHNWQSISAITGKNGILSFSTMSDELIGDGETPVSVNSSDVNFVGASALQQLMLNVPAGTEQVVQYAGQVDYMSMRYTDVSGYQMMFYIAGRSTPDYTFTYQSMQDDKLSYLGFIIDDENEVAKPCIYQPFNTAEPSVIFYPADFMSDTDMRTVWLFIHGHYNPDEDDPGNNNPEEDGEGGGWNNIPISGISKPGKSAVNTGFTSMFMIGDTELQNLSRFLWSADFVPNLQKFFGDPREIIVGLTIMPVEPDINATPEVIQAGGISTGVYGNRLTDQYKLLEDIGYIDIPEDKKQKFLNYEPYTRITAHLPFVGEHTLDTSDIMGHRLSLSYIIDFLTGSCVAQISRDGEPRYFFGGSCGMQIPTSSEDFSKTYSSLLSAGASIGSALATIATGGMTAPLAIGAAASMMSNGMNMSPNVMFSSGSGGTNSMLSSQTAFLKVETPNEKMAVHQSRDTGRQSLIRATVHECRGFTKFLTLHLHDISATAEEMDRIRQYLTSGIRIEEHSNTMPDLTPTTATDHVIVLMKCKSDADVLGKKWTDAVKIEGKLMYGQDITTPIFVLEGSYQNYNYAYVPEFERFYFINRPKIETGNIVTLPMSVDVLESFRTELLDSENESGGILERQQSIYNTYMNDTMIWTQANRNVDIVPFLNESKSEMIFSRLNNRFIITIAGG